MAKDDRKLPAHAIPKAPYKIVRDLPADKYLGIGKVVAAHALLEEMVSRLLFTLMKIDENVGRSSMGYRAASERFKTAKILIGLHGLSVLTPLNDLENQIKGCCDMRDQFAHGIWMHGLEHEIALRLTRGVYETPEGKGDRRFVPEGLIIPDDYYDGARKIILSTVRGVSELIDEVTDGLEAQRKRSPEPPGPSGHK